MKKNYLGAFFALLAFFVCENTFAQNLCVYEDEGIKHCLSLEDVENLTFSEEQVFLKKTDGSINEFTISDVSKIKLEEEDITSVETLLISDKEIRAFPNPVEDILTIESTDEVVKIFLFDMNGNLILQKEPKERHTTIQLTIIPTGMYNLQIVTPNGDYVIEKIIKK